jgi:peptidoglycan hydrolase-like protein with peptidoglycan-binding domain
VDESDYEFEFDFLSDRETGEEEWHHDTGEETFVSEPHVAPRERRPTPPEVVRRRRIFAGAAVALVLLIILIVVVTSGSSSSGGPYRSYLNDVSPIAADSQQAGSTLATFLSSSHSATTKAAVLAKLDSLVQQSVNDVRRLQALTPPAALSSAHAQALAALDLRLTALQGLRDSISHAFAATDPSPWLPVVATKVDDLVTSDTIWSDFVRSPAYAVLQANGIGGVNVPDSQFVTRSPESLVNAVAALIGTTEASTASSSNGPALKLGDTGAAVTAWQNQLNSWLRLTSPNQTPLTADGTFGASTQTTTEAFQSAAGLSPDGSVGPATRTAMAKALAAGGKTSTTSGATGATGPSGPTGASGASATPSGPVLKLGSSGSDVTAWQNQLNQWLRTTSGQTLTPDGTFGASTQTATEQLQSASGLAPDGIVGPATRHALQQALGTSPRG